MPDSFKLGEISGKLDAVITQVAAQPVALIAALERQQKVTTEAIDPEQRDIIYKAVNRLLDWMDGTSGMNGAKADIQHLKNNKLRFAGFMAGATTVGSAVGYVVCFLIAHLSGK